MQILNSPKAACTDTHCKACHSVEVGRGGGERGGGMGGGGRGVRGRGREEGWGNGGGGAGGCLIVVWVEEFMH